MLHQPQHLGGARARLRCALAPVWMRTASAIWWPMVSTGLRLVIGSWKIIAMRLPRMLAHLGLVERDEIAVLEA